MVLFLAVRLTVYISFLADSIGPGAVSYFVAGHFVVVALARTVDVCEWAVELGQGRGSLEVVLPGELVLLGEGWKGSGIGIGIAVIGVGGLFLFRSVLLLFFLFFLLGDLLFLYCFFLLFFLAECLDPLLFLLDDGLAYLALLVVPPAVADGLRAGVEVWFVLADDLEALFVPELAIGESLTEPLLVGVAVNLEFCALGDVGAVAEAEEAVVGSVALFLGHGRAWLVLHALGAIPGAGVAVAVRLLGGRAIRWLHVHAPVVLGVGEAAVLPAEERGLLEVGLEREGGAGQEVFAGVVEPEAVFGGQAEILGQVGAEPLLARVVEPLAVDGAEGAVLLVEVAGALVLRVVVVEGALLAVVVPQRAVLRRAFLYGQGQTLHGLAHPTLEGAPAGGGASSGVQVCASHMPAPLVVEDTVVEQEAVLGSQRTARGELVAALLHSKGIGIPPHPRSTAGSRRAGRSPPATPRTTPAPRCSCPPRRTRTPAPRRSSCSRRPSPAPRSSSPRTTPPTCTSPSTPPRPALRTPRIGFLARTPPPPRIALLARTSTYGTRCPATPRG